MRFLFVVIILFFTFHETYACNPVVTRSVVFQIWEPGVQTVVFEQGGPYSQTNQAQIHFKFYRNERLQSIN